MNGTKFKLSCTSCNATFFDADRRARYCPKCVKKKNLSQPAMIEHRPERRTNPDGAKKPLLSLRPTPKPKPVKEKPAPRPIKATEATPEHRERIRQIYSEQMAGKEFVWKEIVSKISDELMLDRKIVSTLLGECHFSKAEISDETKARITEMYTGFVERGERPKEGRRKNIARQFGLSYLQVRDIVYEYSLARYTASPTPEPTREQKFELEKLFFAEVEKARFRWSELPEQLAEQIPIFNSWQVARWIDMLFDNKPNVANAPDVGPEIEQKIVEAYKQYLAAPHPPEQSLHATLAEQIGGITNIQVHKVLQNYRNRLRDNYPLK